MLYRHVRSVVIKDRPFHRNTCQCGNHSNDHRTLYSTRTEESSESPNTPKNNDNKKSKSTMFSDIARGGKAELLLAKSSLEDYYDDSKKEEQQHQQLMNLANACRQAYRAQGIAHIPNFVRPDVCHQMVQEATLLADTQQCFYSTEDHTVYQEPHDPAFSNDHPRNALQQSSKWIMDYDRIVQQSPTSPLVRLYTSPHLKAFVAYVVQPPSVKSIVHNDTSDDTQQQQQQRQQSIYESGCLYNAAYYNKYDAGDGLGWHFDRSEFGINLELQPADQGGDFELCWNTRSVTPSDIAAMDDGHNYSDDRLWVFQTVEDILKESCEAVCPLAQRIGDPPVGAGSLVFFAGSRNLHRVTPVSSASPKPRINAIMTYETKPDQKPNAYSLQKFFGR